MITKKDIAKLNAKAKKGEVWFKCLVCKYGLASSPGFDSYEFLARRGICLGCWRLQLPFFMWRARRNWSHKRINVWLRSLQKREIKAMVSAGWGLRFLPQAKS